MFNEKVAYLKGLASGLGLDGESKEGRVLSAIIDALDELTGELDDLRDDVSELEETLDEIEDSFDELSDFLGDIVGGLEDNGDGEGSFPHLKELSPAEGEDDGLYEITCPGCDEKFTVDEDTLLKGGVSCPGCKEKLVFDLGGCGHGDCDCKHKHKHDKDDE